MQRQSPAAARNLAPIAERLDALLPASGRLLELASGPGEHAAHLAARYPDWLWQPSDVDPAALASIAAWRAAGTAANLCEALCIDLDMPGWWRDLTPHWDVLLAVNVCHIAPWSVTLGLLDGAAALLDPEGALLIYGPFRRDGAHTGPGNAAFDASLRSRDARWGVRCLDSIDAEACTRGLRLVEAHRMPADNLLAELRRV